MAIHAQSSCTLSAITDVEAVYTYYYLSDSTITIDEAPKDGVNAPGASSITVVSDGHSYVWQITEPQLDIQDDVIQTAVGKLYYIECVEFSDGTYDWGPLMTSSTYAAAKAAYNLSSQALAQAQAANDTASLLGGHFIYNSTWQTTNTPHSANIVQTIEKNGIDVSQDPTNWGYNVHIGSNGIKIRHDEITLSDWTTNQLTFYNPVTHGADATLNSNGLTLVKGGIEAGQYNNSSTNFVYLSTKDYSGQPTVTINGNSSNWRQIIGTKFGVKNDGTLYAENAHISGQITIGGHSDTLENELESLQNSVDNTLIYDHTYEFLPEASNPTSVRFTAHVYQGGEEITNNFDDSRFTWFYKSETIAGEVPVLNNTKEVSGDIVLINEGKTITIGSIESLPSDIDTTGYLDFEDINYGIEIIGKFTPPESSALATTNNEPLADTNGRALLSSTRSSGETVKVRELSYTTSLTSTDAIMVVTSNDEKLVTLANLAAALNVGVSDVRVADTSVVSGGIANIPLATSTTNGVMSAADKTKLDNIPASFTSNVNDVRIGNNSIVVDGIANIPLATDSIDGMMSKEDKGRLESLQVVVGGVGLVAINRLSFDPSRKSLKIFDVNMDILPTVPTTSGIYRLQVDVDSEGHTYSWV